MSYNEGKKEKGKKKQQATMLYKRFLVMVQKKAKCHLMLIILVKCWYVLEIRNLEINMVWKLVTGQKRSEKMYLQSVESKVVHKA